MTDFQESVSELHEHLIIVLRPAIEEIVRDVLSEYDISVWMTTEQAAEYLRTTPEAIAHRARRGSLPAHRDGHRWMFRRDELDASVKS